FSIGFFLNVLAPIILAFVFKNDVDEIFSRYKIISYLPQIGLCFYPLTVAFVLGVRNGNNQKQLVEQLVYIKKLGQENLLKESEKKKILEEQNIVLEHMVKQRTQELALKNELIMVKNREITDNVTYAKRIQAAILPNRKTIQQHLPQSFILYIPKDIVSGDFYGFSVKQNKIIIAAADCTGHGVAGAFMSMVGSSLLNQIINEKNITTPALILDELNEGIIESLKQRDSVSNDGMDIAICAFDNDFKTVSYAGANRPLWLIRQGQLYVTIPNKFPIGGMQVLHDEKFTNHTISLQPGDTLYIFSDGYADQFGETTGKKLMTKKFKEVLLHQQDQSMAQQKENLRQTLLSWQGNTEQVDDILVIGIRI
ncbi:MAG TPA: SpoIIE family protein phosphatase, partial [Bacteroidia bacterium]|nr:SpoIIE family protein phosphatase [Bacteroidia bacterium]